ncbi:glycosyltransferase family 2 protein [Salipiger mangrovisoli]|uniref:Glycosyltransferase n=1 Tax=Salipiger mangrovisoli TaxID=2865933 RepID=A0ABR9X6H8_9RHOB|nr:glycosyltransferase [Salipiger mangrovisoli]MBE9639171.1 glycosyltransferase [Salipiger mangrovisoli]
MFDRHDVVAVVIGRNEGERLRACLASVQSEVARVIYVDSGSDDGSQALAVAMGVELVDLPMHLPFTAARARNVGFAQAATGTCPPYVQFIDGDCVLQPGWIETATRFLAATPHCAVVCGRRRERFPEISVYNRLMDAEWATRPGRAKACGGDALVRATAVASVGGFNADLIAGEEPELCVRLRTRGWSIWRLDQEMTLHDADIRSLRQWWQRGRRGGYAYAEGAALHGRAPEFHGIRGLLRSLAWTTTLPVALGLAWLETPWAMLLLLAWPAQVGRRIFLGDDPEVALFNALAKIPEAHGALTYLLRRVMRRKPCLIEYK